jgi:hypothetical protein
MSDTRTFTIPRRRSERARPLSELLGTVARIAHTYAITRNKYRSGPNARGYSTMRVAISEISAGTGTFMAFAIPRFTTM